MLLDTLERFLLPEGKKIRQQHSPDDFIKISFQLVGDEIHAVPKPGRHYRVYGYVVDA